MGLLPNPIVWKLYHIIVKYSNPNIGTNLLVGKVKNGLGVELTNGRSLGGYNLALCVYHFIFALILVLAGGVSFWLGGREEEESKR